MRTIWVAALILVGMTFPPAVFAQTAATVTAVCKDGTDYSGKSRRGACSDHGGVQTFKSPTTVPAPAARVQSPPSPTPSRTQPAAAPSRPPTVQATGAASGQVWVNTSSKVYHCPGTRYFGKTKAGAYMAEAAAKAEGDRPDHGKACFQ